MSVPRVSVVIPTRDRPAMLRRAIESVLVQTMPDLEVVVVDDASGPSTRDVVDAIGDPRVRYIRRERSQGGPAARNHGFRESRGEWVALLDDDDLWLPSKLERQLQLAAGADPVAAVACHAVAVDGSGRRIGRARAAVRGSIREHVAGQGLVTVSSASLIRRGALEAIGGHDETLPSNMDHDLWMSLGRAGYHADYVDDALVVAYQHEGDRMTADVGPRLEAVRLYLDKWAAELDEWMGPSAEEYRRRYLARVVSSAAAEQIAAGHVRAAGRAIRVLYRDGAGFSYNSRVLLRRVGRRLLRRFVRRTASEPVAHGHG